MTLGKIWLFNSAMSYRRPSLNLSVIFYSVFSIRLDSQKDIIPLLKLENRKAYWPDKWVLFKVS